jgi:sn-glycerol 3-phosphate transport system permease protein
MVGNRPWLNVLAHLTLVIGVILVLFPMWVAFVASTHPRSAFFTGVMPIWPGGEFLANYAAVLGTGASGEGLPPVAPMMLNSLVMALAITFGKIAISLMSAFAIVYFRFPLRMLAFWLIFLTLMLPVEVRIVPTYQVIASLGMLNSYAGLTIPLIASATATFLYRQLFLTIPDELAEAARVDGAGPWRFFRDILEPMSRTNTAALFVILFIYGWNQYLWPLLVTTDPDYYTVVMGIQRLARAADADPFWNLVMATALLAMMPPVLVTILMQRWFVKGLIESEK